MSAKAERAKLVGRYEVPAAPLPMGAAIWSDDEPERFDLALEAVEEAKDMTAPPTSESQPDPWDYWELPTRETDV